MTILDFCVILCDWKALGLCVTETSVKNIWYNMSEIYIKYILPIKQFICLEIQTKYKPEI